mgnify:CR=1 FL=1
MTSVTAPQTTQVNKIALKNVANGNLYFDSRRGLNNEQNSFKVDLDVYPINALNRNVRYAYIANDEDFENLKTEYGKVKEIIPSSVYEKLGLTGDMNANGYRNSLCLSREEYIKKQIQYEANNLNIKK